jgi:AbrB family looped-hinge helix DNA binding protein
MPLLDINGIMSKRWQIVTETAVLGESGRIVVPASIRNEFGLKTGDRLTFIAKDGRIEILSMNMALKELQDSIISECGSLEGILDEFLEERHEEARREQAEDD